MSSCDKVIESKLDIEYYFGEEGAEPLENVEDTEGLEVIDGNHVVPPGVAVEELKNYNGQKDLKDKCPEKVHELLLNKGLFDVYDKFVQTIYDDKTTRGPLGKWRDAQFISILDMFREDFAEKGVKVALCKRKSGKGSYRWIEFVDVDQVGDSYIPQYDQANLSGQIIKTCYTKLKFPNGVAVEELKQHKGRKKLKEKMPIYVEKLLKDHDLLSEYDQLVDHVIEAGRGQRTKMWNIEKLKGVLDVYKPIFSAKGVDLFVSHKQEYISHGQYGGHIEYYRWIEFVDRSIQPNYFPQRDSETKKQEECNVM
ncbi:hypothetical protein CTEN210_02494 [Chaetoceros tenuissimus]|uniref:Uncharacterized protein n=1 Tax=Chaetoceros tenuissimus TaxID=426638 RepID=A0AAD3CJX3_9STRA|nr:hypothetical protein CTEN210_02494 [Chaetoceros tenuissimus]